MKIGHSFFKNCIFCSTKIYNDCARCYCTKLKYNDFKFNGIKHVIYSINIGKYTISYLLINNDIKDMAILHNESLEWVIKGLEINGGTEYNRPIIEFDFSNINAINEQIELLEMLK